MAISLALAESSPTFPLTSGGTLAAEPRSIRLHVPEFRQVVPRDAFICSVSRVVRRGSTQVIDALADIFEMLWVAADDVAAGVVEGGCDRSYHLRVDESMSGGHAGPIPDLSVTVTVLRTGPLPASIRRRCGSAEDVIQALLRSSRDWSASCHSKEYNP